METRFWTLRCAMIAPVGLALAAPIVHAVKSAPLELEAPELAVTPIFHQRYYLGERELFGYAPSFVPNVVTFDKQNRPYMRGCRFRRSRPGIPI